MKSGFRIRGIDVMVVVALVGYTVYRESNRAPRSRVAATEFASKVDLRPLDRTAVHADGRLRSFESHAKTYMGIVSGSRSIDGQTNAFTYLDLMLRPERYADAPIIYVKNKLVLNQILDALKDDPRLTPEMVATTRKSGLLSRTLIREPAVVAFLQKLGQDLIKGAKPVDAIQSAMGVSDPRFLLENLRMIAPPSGELNKPWVSLNELSSGGAPQDSAHGGMGGQKALPGVDKGIQDQLGSTWSALRIAWRTEDAAGVNAALATMAELLPTISPSIYPAPGRLAMESWYFRTSSMTWVWLLYLASVVPLLMAIVYHWDGARRAGMVLFGIAFLGHTASLLIRWYVSGRWPNSNMFEAVHTSAWFGGVGAIILERLVRRSAFRNMFALGSAIMSMAALMAAYFLPADLDSSISNKMAALNDIWLYIHTNMIIWSYAVIGIACVPAVLFLRHRWCTLWDGGSVPRVRLLVLPVSIAALNYTAYVFIMNLIDPVGHGLHGTEYWAVSAAMWSSLMVIIGEALSARGRRTLGAAVERSASGGASALLMGSPSAGGFLTQEKPTATQVYDGATMILVEISFIMLWTGLVMGAIWADHSWGRPWGWDPKEVFALNTFLIFLILIHVRMKVRDKAFWTAVLAVVGFEVMMFNWIVVNFVISGLHSYA